MPHICMRPSVIDPILKSYGSFIEDFAYSTENAMAQ